MDKINWKELAVPGGILAAVLFGGYWLFLRKPEEAQSPALPKPTSPQLPSKPAAETEFPSGTGDVNAGAGGTYSGTFSPNVPADLEFGNLGVPSLGNVLNAAGIGVPGASGVQIPGTITSPAGGGGTYAVSISSGRLNARSGPANVPNEQNVVFKLSPNETVSHIEGPVSGDGSQGNPPSGGWVKVRRGNGMTGWVSKRYLRVLTPIQEAA